MGTTQSFRTVATVDGVEVQAPVRSAQLDGLVEALRARGFAVEADGTRVWYEGSGLAFLRAGTLVLCGVLRADRHDAYLFGMGETVCSTSERPADLAAECIARILARRGERAKLEDAKARQLASYVCPGPACREALCGGHSRPAHTSAAPPSLAGCLEQAERTSGLKGAYTVAQVASLVRITWAPTFGSSTRIVDEALGAAVRAFRAAGYEAQRAPGLAFVDVYGAEALIAADEPGVDHEHPVRDDLEPVFAVLDMAAE